MTPLIGFVFLFLTIQNIAMYFEAEGYPKFISDIQHETSSMMKNGLPTPKVLFSYIAVYVSVLLLFYTFILRKNSSLSEAFLLGTCVYAVVDTFMYGIFRRTKYNHIPTLLYDIFIVGGVSFALSLYIYKEYKSMVSRYTPFFIGTFILSFIVGIRKVSAFENEYKIEQS